MSTLKQEPIECVGVVCFRGDEVLLIKRGKPPKKGAWSIPGGRIEPGETECEACARELLEETGVTADIGEKLLSLDAEFEGVAYRLHDYLAVWEQGEPLRGDDADWAGFVIVDEALSLPMWEETKTLIRSALARRDGS